MNMWSFILNFNNTIEKIKFLKRIDQTTYKKIGSKLKGD